MKIYTNSLYGMVLFLFVSVVSAQEPRLVLDKNGDFKITVWSIYSCSDCGYTKTEEKANYSKLAALSDILRKNPVLEDIKGFDCNVMLYSEFYGDKKYGYGIPGKMSVQFCYFFNDKGKVASATIEPPSFGIHINQLSITSCNSLGFRTSGKINDADNPNFNQKKWDLAAEKSSPIFFIPGKKETLVPGVDVYADETVIVYNPERPDYWLPVTIKEIFEAWIDFYKYGPYKYESEITLKMLEEEYALFSDDEKNSNAYSGGRGPAPLLNVDTNVNDVQVMRLNPKYWNTNLPKSDIQILSFNVLQDKNRYTTEAKEQLKYNGGSYHLTRFLEALDIKSLLSVIDR